MIDRYHCKSIRKISWKAFIMQHFYNKKEKTFLNSSYYLQSEWILSYHRYLYIIAFLFYMICPTFYEKTGS